MHTSKKYSRLTAEMERKISKMSLDRHNKVSIEEEAKERRRTRGRKTQRCKAVQIFKKTDDRPNASSDDSSEFSKSRDSGDDEDQIESMRKENPGVQSGPPIFKKTINRPNASSDNPSEFSKSHGSIEREPLEEYYYNSIEANYSEESSGDDSVEFPSEWFERANKKVSQDEESSSD